MLTSADTIRNYILNANPFKTSTSDRFSQTTGVVRPRDLLEVGLPKDYLNLLSREGILVKLRLGLYQWPEREVSRHQSLIEVAKLVPKGVVTLLSVLNFHGLGTQTPFEVWLAIDRKARCPSVGYLPVRFVTMSYIGFTEGVEYHEIDGVWVPVSRHPRCG